MTAFPLTTLAILLALLVYFGFSIVVGRARSTYNVPAPQSSGHPEFDKRNRVQLNTLEQLAMFIPAIVLAAPVLGDHVAAIVGLVWSIGRLLFARGYYVDPSKRSLGFALTMLPTLILIIAATWGAISALG
jgi:glutathione S-transferase